MWLPFELSVWVGGVGGVCMLFCGVGCVGVGVGAAGGMRVVV